MSVIPFKEAMRQAESGSPFKVGFCTADYKRKIGGEYIELSGVKLKGIEPLPKKKGDGIHIGRGIKTDFRPTEAARLPKHRENDTRNLIVPGKSNPVKFHPRLMIMFNDMELIY